MFETSKLNVLSFLPSILHAGVQYLLIEAAEARATA